MPTNSPDRPFSQSLKWALWVYFAFFLAIYALLQLKYRPTEIDDPWWCSFAYNFLYRHITYDLSAGATVAYNGIIHFGKGYAFILGTFLDFFGWTKPNSYCLSLSFIFAGFTTWYFTLRRFQYSRELAATFCVTGLLLDPFFTSSLCDRAEAYVFLMSSLALFLFVYDLYFWAILAAFLSFETHPIGAVAFFLMAAAFWAKKPRTYLSRPHLFRDSLFVLGGFGAGFLYLSLLYPGDLANLPGILLNANHRSDLPTQNFIMDYFFHSKYHRHLADLALLLICSFEFFRKKMFKNDPLVLPLAISLVLFTLIFRRPNYHYALYFYPLFLLMLAKVFEARWNLLWMAWGLLALMVPQYAVAYHMNKDYDYNSEVQNCQKMIPADSLPLLGDPNTWFAFPSREFYFNQYFGDISKLGLKRFYLVYNQDYWQTPSETKTYIQTHFKPKPLGDFSFGRWKISIDLEEPAKQNPE